MSRNHKKIIKASLFVFSLFVLAVVLASAPRIIMDRFGPSNAHAAVDNTKEVMTTCITDAKDIWLAASGPAGKATDGDKIAIAIVASKLFEARYLLTYIE